MTDSTTQPTVSRRKRGLSPLALVLLLSTGFFVIFLIVSSSMFFSKRGGDTKPRAGTLFKGSGAVGILEVKGVILDAKKTIKRLESLEEDNEIKGVVLRLNSPGGAVAPSQEIYQAVKAFKKPLVVSMGSVAASGGYYIACGAKKVYANPGTITGSIGVIMEFANLEKLYAWLKVDRYAIKTGKFKDAGAEYRAMTAEERALLQGMVDDVLVQFKQAVSEGRGLKMEQVTRIADGRIFSGNQAKAEHMVDELGTLQDAIKDVAKQAGIKGKPEVVYSEKPRNRFMEFFVDNMDRDESSESSSAPGHSLLADVVRLIVREAGGPAASLTESASSVLPPGVYWLWKAAR